MQEKINKFKEMNLEEQKEILLIVMKKSIDKSEGIAKLYKTVESVDTSIELDVIKIEFLKIYTFLMEAVEYIKSQNLQSSINNLDKINKTLEEMRVKELKEIESEDIENILESELGKL